MKSAKLFFLNLTIFMTLVMSIAALVISQRQARIGAEKLRTKSLGMFLEASAEIYKRDYETGNLLVAAEKLSSFINASDPNYCLIVKDNGDRVIYQKDLANICQTPNVIVLKKQLFYDSGDSSAPYATLTASTQNPDSSFSFGFGFGDLTFTFIYLGIGILLFSILGYLISLYLNEVLHRISANSLARFD